MTLPHYLFHDFTTASSTRYPLFVLLSFALLFPADIGALWDDRLFAWIARFAAFVFIIFQSVVFLDWAYQFNESFMKVSARYNLIFKRLFL